MLRDHAPFILFVALVGLSLVFVYLDMSEAYRRKNRRARRLCAGCLTPTVQRRASMTVLVSPEECDRSFNHRRK